MTAKMPIITTSPIMINLAARQAIRPKVFLVIKESLVFSIGLCWDSGCNWIHKGLSRKEIFSVAKPLTVSCKTPVEFCCANVTRGRTSHTVQMSFQFFIETAFKDQHKMLVF